MYGAAVESHAVESHAVETGPHYSVLYHYKCLSDLIKNGFRILFNYLGVRLNMKILIAYEGISGVSDKRGGDKCGGVSDVR